MVFQNPGLEALHQYITGNQKAASPIEETMVKEEEKKVEIEAIAKELEEDTRLKRPHRK